MTTKKKTSIDLKSISKFIQSEKERLKKAISKGVKLTGADAKGMYAAIAVRDELKKAKRAAEDKAWAPVVREIDKWGREQ